MKPLLLYWFVGCVVVGLPLGSLLKECPNAKVNSAEMVATAAMWPAVLLAAFTMGPQPKTGCEAAMSPPVSRPNGETP